MRINFQKSVFTLLIVLAAVLTGCNSNEPNYQLSDMQGLWQENGTEHFMRFTTESANDLKAGYLWGYEWDEA